MVQHVRCNILRLGLNRLRGHFAPETHLVHAFVEDSQTCTPIGLQTCDSYPISENLLADHTDLSVKYLLPCYALSSPPSSP